MTINDFNNFYSECKKRQIKKIGELLPKTEEVAPEQIEALAENPEFVEQFGEDCRENVSIPGHIVAILGKRRIELIVERAFKEYHEADANKEDIKKLAKDEDFIQYTLNYIMEERK